MDHHNVNVSSNGKSCEKPKQDASKMGQESQIKLFFQSDDVLLAYVIAQYANKKSN